MRQILASSALLLGMSFSNIAMAQFAVIDWAALANTGQQVQQQIEEIKNQVAQIQELKSQLEQAKKLYDSMNQITGVNDLAGLLKSDDILHALPEEFGQMQASLSDLIDQNATKYDHFDTSGSSANNFYLQELARQKKETYTDLSVGQKVYDTASKRVAALETLRDQVGKAVTQKEILDLSARISAESALLQNDQIKMQSLAMVQQARDRVDAQRQQEERIKNIDETVAAARSN